MQVARINTATENYLISIEPDIDIVTDGYIRVIAVEEAEEHLQPNQYMLVEWAIGLPIPTKRPKH